MRCKKITTEIYASSLFVLMVMLFTAASACSQNTAPEMGGQKGPSYDLAGKILEFNVIDPVRNRYTIENIKIIHESERTVPVQVSITGLRHNDTNNPLDPHEWLKINPAEGTASVDNPFQFNLEARLPKEITAGIPDGLYVGRLKIESGEAAFPIYVPFQFTLSLPDFSVIPEDLPEKGLAVPFSCCIPGSRTISFGMTSDAMTKLPVQVFAPVNIKNENEESIPSNYLEVHMKSSGGISAEENIAPAGKEQTDITLNVIVKNPVLPSGRYEGQIFVRGDYGRSISMPLYIDIAEKGQFWVDKYWYYFAVGAALFIVLLVVRPIRLFFARRRLNERALLRIDKNGKVPAQWNQYFSASYTGTPDRDQWTLVPRTQAKSIALKTSNKFDSSRANQVTLEGPCVLIIQSRRNQIFELSVSSVTQFGLQMRVTRSPYSSSRIAGEGVLYIVITTILAGSAYHPQVWCSLFPFLQ
jgi:hypothetical protein